MAMSILVFIGYAVGWVYREWAPAADAMYLMGDFNDWNKSSHPMQKLDNGIFEITLKTKELWHGCRIKAVVVNGDQVLERIPLYATRVEQDPETYLWTGVVWHPKKKYEWNDEGFKGEKIPYIYECHIGMA